MIAKNSEPNTPPRRATLTCSGQFQLRSETHAILKQLARPDRKALLPFLTASQRNEDLLASFPAAAVAIARQRGAMLARAEAMGAIRQGAPLKDVARLLDLPDWTRRLPPAALQCPFPDTLTRSNDSKDFGRRLVIPAAFVSGSRWLAIVEQARCEAPMAFTAWLMAQLARHPDVDLPPLVVSILIAYARMPRMARGRHHAMIEREWSPQATLASSLAVTLDWMRNFTAAIHHYENRDASAPSIPCRSDGHVFEELTTVSALRREGRLMHNCLGDYGAVLSLGVSRFFSLRKDGQHLASIQVTMLASYRDPQRFRLRMAAGPRNVALSPDILAIIDRWLQDLNGSNIYAPIVMAPRLEWRRIWSRTQLRARPDLVPADDKVTSLAITIINELDDCLRVLKPPPRPASRRRRA